MGIRTHPHLCILNIDGYPLFNDGCKSVFGGAEVQLWLIACSLAATDKFDISVVVADHGQSSLEYQAGLKLYIHPAYRTSARIENSLPTFCRWWWRRLMFSIELRLHPNVDYIGNRAMYQARVALYDDIDAHIYLCKSNTTRAAELAWYCKDRGKKFIFWASSDIDYDLSSKYRNKQLQKYVIEEADLHIVQTEYQHGLLRDNFGRESTIIRNLVDTDLHFSSEIRSDTILWVGKQNEIKRPEIFIKLAKELEEYQFALIANPMLGLANYLEKWLPTPPNVTFLEYIPFHQIERYFATAKLLINTSIFEGLPNTFLQAAKYGVPIVSLQVDPDNMLSEHKCGLFCNGSFDQLLNNVRTLMAFPDLYSELSSNCKVYIREYHNMEKAIKAYEKAFISVLD